MASVRGRINPAAGGHHHTATATQGDSGAPPYWIRFLPRLVVRRPKNATDHIDGDSFRCPTNHSAKTAPRLVAPDGTPRPAINRSRNVAPHRNKSTVRIDHVLVDTARARNHAGSPYLASGRKEKLLGSFRSSPQAQSALQRLP